jgi:hypothetical protein
VLALAAETYRSYGHDSCSLDASIAQWFPGLDHHVVTGPSEGQLLDAYQASVDEMPDYPAIQAVATASIATTCAAQAGSTSPGPLWHSAVAFRTSTMYGSFEIDQATGTQVSHRTILTRWIDRSLVALKPT